MLLVRLAHRHVRSHTPTRISVANTHVRPISLRSMHRRIDIRHTSRILVSHVRRTCSGIRMLHIISI